MTTSNAPTKTVRNIDATGLQCPGPIMRLKSELEKVQVGEAVSITTRDPGFAAAMGSEVTLFFTFWGLNILRKKEAVPVKKTMIEKMFGWMMPRGADKLTLSKMNMSGMAMYLDHAEAGNVNLFI